MQFLSRLGRGGTRATAAALGAALLAASCILPASASDVGAFARSAHGKPSVLPRGCGSCHVGHGSPHTAMFRDSQEATCLKCHGDASGKSTAQANGLLRGAGSAANIAAEFAKPSTHPLARFGTTASTAAFSKTSAAPSTPSSAVTCSSCHDPHYLIKPAGAAIVDPTQPKQVSDARGKQQPEYAICYRCHGAGAARDIQRLMRSSNPSYHPLEAPARNAMAPSLLQPYTAHSYVACTDCHGSDQANVQGPHGSTFEPVLKGHFRKDDGQAESGFEYALCYNCHNRSVVLSPASFPLHTLHVVNGKTSCHTCHDSHGAVLYDHLISFDTTQAFGNSKGQFNYQSLGPQHGMCNLLCHGHDHVQKKY